MVIADVTVLTGERGPWASPPSKPMIDRDGVVMKDAAGKIRYVPVIDFVSKDVRNKFSAAVIEAMRGIAPGVRSKMNADAGSIHLAWFETAEAPRRSDRYGRDARLDGFTHRSYVTIDAWVRRTRRVFAPTRFTPEQGSRHPRCAARSRNAAIARTGAIALDIECDKEDWRGSTAARRHRPDPGGNERAQRQSSTQATRTSRRCRAIAWWRRSPVKSIPCRQSARYSRRSSASAAFWTGSKIRAGAGVFYLPTCASEDALDRHEALAVDGHAIDAEWITREAATLQAERDAEQERIAAEEHAAAAERSAGAHRCRVRSERQRHRKDPRPPRLPRCAVGPCLRPARPKWRHPNSTSGAYGADIQDVRAASNASTATNGTDPLHKSNLPSWCSVAAIDVFDVVCILDFGGDRERALRELAERFGTAKASEHKTLAKLLFRLIRDQAPQETIESDAFAEGVRLGLTHSEVCHVALWVAKATGQEAA